MVEATATASGDVTVTWMDGENAERHIALLINSDFEVEGDAVPNPTSPYTFMSVPAGTYFAVVMTVDANSEFEYDYDLVTVQ